MGTGGSGAAIDIPDNEVEASIPDEEVKIGGTTAAAASPAPGATPGADKITGIAPPPSATTIVSGHPFVNPSNDIGARLDRWVSAVGDDIKHGSTSTVVGRGLHALGAPGTESGEPPNLPQNVGKFAATLLTGPAGGAEALTPEAVAASADWAKINEAIGAGPASIRLPKSASSIEGAITNPARGLQNEGFSGKSLAKLSPMEQQAAVAPKWNAAGRAVDQTLADATTRQIVVNPSKSALSVAGSIPNPTLREKAVQQLSDLMQEVGIHDPQQASPTQVGQLRRALRSGARFGPSGDLSSLGGIRGKLYAAVTNDLHAAVPGLDAIDQRYSDLNSAISVINKKASGEAVTPDPSLISRLAPPTLKTAAGAAGLGTLYELWRRFSPK